MSSFSIKGNLVDVHRREIYAAEVTVANGIISSIHPINSKEENITGYIMPGFIDSHVHIESSMLVPSEFAKLAVVHGTVATVSDPHEIANVCGMKGVAYMIQNGKTVPFKFNFGAPSCVPATAFETAGATLQVKDIDELLQQPDVKYLSEMMNFPGVLQQDDDVMQKIALAQKYNKPVDGHAPGLSGDDAVQYINAGITTDHECVTAEEALHKLKHGMSIIIREGSAAKNFDALINLLPDYTHNIMFCSDDKHPDSLEEGHINKLCARAVAKNIDVFKVLQAACVNPVKHYNLGVGLLKTGDAADFIVVKDLQSFTVIKTFINGILVAENGASKIQSAKASIINHFNCTAKAADDFKVPANGRQKIHVIEALDGQLITNSLYMDAQIMDGNIVPDLQNDILKIAVVNRYKDAPVATAFIKNFGLQHGAIASSVAHDSHNIIAVGVDDESLCKAVNTIIQSSGGICAVSKNEEMLLALPVAGLMSNDDGNKVAAAYTAIDNMVKEKMGCTLGAPFMTLSFMALLVIPQLKLSDKGLFDGNSFTFIN